MLRHPRNVLSINYVSIMTGLSINYCCAIIIRWICYKRASTVLSINELWPCLVLLIRDRLAINTRSICECAPNVLSTCYRHAITVLSICYCVAISVVRSSQFRSVRYWCPISVLSTCYVWFNRMLAMRYWTATNMLLICYVLLFMLLILCRFAINIDYESSNCCTYCGCMLQSWYPWTASVLSMSYRLPCSFHR